MKVDVRPLTKSRWRDVEELFSRPGASIPRGCWCMYYRKTGGHGGVGPAAENKKGLKSLVDRGYVPGLIGYHDGRPVGWISLSPREDYPKLQRSPVMKPVDDKPVWSIVCFFVDKEARGKGASEQLLKGAMDYARANGARLLEAYPVDKDEPSHADSMWFGAKRMYDRAGFKEVARRKENRPVVRKPIRPRAGKATSR
ncbi:MAG: GNAT family N-acetyltransferase [Actinomycetota bacterium]|nr:GNAT family N-acetyltransferase [Actinomycetota bacterium]